jgi:hypothetical protein
MNQAGNEFSKGYFATNSRREKTKPHIIQILGNFKHLSEPI